MQPIREYRILIVDDEPLLRVSLQSILEFHGHNVDTAASANEAIRKVHLTAYEVAIVDFMLRSEIDGAELIRKMREIQPGLNSILTSGLPIASLNETASRLGGCGVLTKPFSPTDVHNAIERLNLEQLVKAES